MASAGCQGPPPSYAWDPIDPPPRSASRLQSPFVFDVSNIGKVINEQFPTRNTGDRKRVGKHPLGGYVVASWTFTRGPIDIDVDGNAITMTCRGQYSGKTEWQKGNPFYPTFGSKYWHYDMVKCPRKGMDISLKTTLRWNGNWTINSTTDEASVELDRGASCALDSPVKSAVKKLLDDKRASIATNVELKLNALVGLPGRIRQLWSEAQEPIDIGSDDWLALEPETIYVTPWWGDDKQIGASIGLIANPDVHIDRLPPVRRPRPLPTLSQRNDVDGLDATVEVRVRALEFDEHIRADLLDREFGSCLAKSTVTDVRLAERARCLHFDVRLKAWFGENRYRVIVRPEYDVNTYTLTFEDMWIGEGPMSELIGTPILDELEEASWAPQAGRLEAFRTSLETGYNNGMNGQSSLTIETMFPIVEVEPATDEHEEQTRVVYARDDELVLRFRITGTVD